MFELTPILVLLIIFGFIYAIVALGIRRKERMTLLEKGADPSLFDLPRKTSYAPMKWGLFLIGIAIGIFLGNILEATTVLEPEVSYFSMVFLFGGIALVISYFLGKKEERNE
ncbi:hypothetical protein KA005_57005 [bacterium]|nr:hypothetical protein [bacterium]